MFASQSRPSTAPPPPDKDGQLLSSGWPPPLPSAPGMPPPDYRNPSPVTSMLSARSGNTGYGGGAGGAGISNAPSPFGAPQQKGMGGSMNGPNGLNGPSGPSGPNGPNGPGSSLLLHNLSMHLNNPPGPGSSSATPLPPLPGVSPGPGSSSAVAGSAPSGPVGHYPPPSTTPQNPAAAAAAVVAAAAAVAGTGPSNGASTGTGKLLLLPNGAPPPAGSEEEKIYALITQLLDSESREEALLELSKKREMYEDLALVLWGSFGIMSSLLMEIVNVYPVLSPPSLSAHASNRVCNALALLQCVASHHETRGLFLNAHIPLFLYPFLNTTSKTRPFEYLRLTSLGVIGALVKQNENSDVINFLLSTEIIPLCLRIMETGSELSKTVAIFIVQKILHDDLGLQYICQTYERFYAVGQVLANMVTALQETQAVRLLKHVVRCYLRMSDNPRAREALRACLPDQLKDGTFNGLLKGDLVTKRCLQTLLMNLSERQE